MPYALGVDLGTTFSAAAIERDGRVEVVSLGNHATTIPSMVFLRDGDDPLIGDAAERRGTQEPARLARVFKRRFGDSTPIVLDGTPVSADRLTSIVLRRIVTEVATRLGGQPDVIGVAHPANWGPFKIDLLRQAVQLAGVREATFVSEPVAAAMQYASTDRVEVGDVVAVYDLGGGTFDAAVLRKTPTGFETLGQPEGIERLGGIDFDHAVLAHVRRTIGTALEQLDPNDPAARSAVARLSEECIRGKEALSVDSETTIPVMLPNLQTQVRLTRVEFEDMIRPTLRETVESLQRAIRVSGVELNNVTAVLLAGGSSRIPLISEMLRSELGRPIVTDMHPKHAVAMGAARVAAQQRSAATAPRANAVPPPPVTAPAAPTTTPSPPPPPTPPPPPAPPPPAPVAQSPVTPARSGKGKVVAIAAAVVLAAGGGVFALTRSGSDGGGASPTSTAGVTAPATHEASTTQPAVTEPVATSSPTTVAPTQPTAVSTDPTTTGTPEGILLSADLSGCCSLPDGYTPVPYEQFDVSALYATPDLGPTITGFYAGRSQIVATGDFPDIFVLTTDTELAGAALDQFLVWQGTDQGVDVFTPEGVPAKQHLSAGDGQSDCVTAHGGFVAISVCTFPGIDGLGVLDAFNDANRDLAIRWASDLSVLPAPAGFAWNPFITFDVTFLYGEPDVGHLIDYYGAGTVSDNGGATTIGINLMQTSEGLNDVELNQYLDWEGTAAGADVVTPGGLTAQQQLLAYEDTDCVTAYNDTDFVTVCTPAGVDGLPFADALYDALVAQRQD